MEELIKPGVLSPAKVVPVTLFFLAMSVGSIAIDVITPANWGTPGPTIIAERAERRRAARVGDGTMMRVVEEELRRRSRMQRAAASVWSAVLLEAGREGNADVIVGKSPWLFHRERTEISRSFQERGPEIAGSYFAAVARRFESWGTRTAVAPLPRKAVVCADRLPSGLDPSPRVDERLLIAARRGGAVVIDLLDPWQSMPSPSVYRALDTHWAVGGRTTFARGIRDAFPDLAVEGPAVPFEVQEIFQDADLTGVLGIRGGGIGSGLVDRPPSQVVRVEEGALDQLLAGRPDDGVLTVAGTSFSGVGDMEAILGGAMGRWVQVSDLGGGTVGQTLTELIQERGLRGLPRHLVYEMPICLVVVAIDRFGKERRTMGETFWHLPPAMATAVEPNPVGDPVGDDLIANFPAGSILSSGDGVLGVRLTASQDDAGRYLVHMGDFCLHVETGADRTSVVIPLLEEGAVRVAVDGDGAASGPVRVDVVHDCDLQRIRSLRAPAETGAVGATRFDGADTVDLFDTLVVKGRLVGPVSIEVDGARADGGKETLTWTFEQASAASAFLGVGLFAGGRIESVTVTTSDPRGPLSAGIAPLARVAR